MKPAQMLFNLSTVFVAITVAYQKPAFAAVLLLVAGLLAAGCAKESAESEGIKIGVVTPTTGREGKSGQYQKEGTELAIKQINRCRRTGLKADPTELNKRSHFCWSSGPLQLPAFAGGIVFRYA